MVYTYIGYDGIYILKFEGTRIICNSICNKATGDERERAML